jgi:hypothetical protein
MKDAARWVRHFLMALGASTVFLLAVYVMRGMDLDRAIREAAMWGLIAASIFIGGRYYNAKRGKACALCRDTAET